VFSADGTVKDPWALVGRFPRTSSFATNTTRSVPAPSFTTTTYPQSNIRGKEEQLGGARLD
jgi:hypothetical protein